MEINLSKIYAGLKAWRDERGITAQSQKAGYIVNVMEEFGELAEALRDYEKIKNGELVYKDNTKAVLSLTKGIIAEPNIKEITLKVAESTIIDALCDIAVFTINTFDDEAPTSISLARSPINKNEWLAGLLVDIGRYSYGFDYDDAYNVLSSLIELCKYYGFDFSIAMVETIKEISSRTGSYSESAKKWVKDESEQARAKWYKADYEKARIEK